MQQLNPSLHDLYRSFPDRGDEPIVTSLSAEAIPEPYRRLLVHEHHMTVTLETYFGKSVTVQVLQSHQSNHEYSRKITLTLSGTKHIVQFGVVQIDLAKVSQEISSEILAEKTPLGRILISAGAMRTVRPVAFFRATPPPILCQWLQLAAPSELFGRLGVLTVDGEPAIQVAEILTPISLT